MNTQTTTSVPVVPVQLASQTPSSLVITLVHGTILFERWRFWRRAHHQGAATPLPGRLPEGTKASSRPKPVEWFEEGSQFRERLQRALRIPCVVTQLEWSGANREWDRLRAAGADADLLHKRSAQAAPDQTPSLREHIAKYPGADHVLIAHSHGGNVCLAALNDPQTRRAVRALVCLSTPFISVRGRSDSRVLMAFLQGARAAVLLVAFIGSIALIDKWLPEPWSTAIWVSGLLLVAFAIASYSTFTGEQREALRRWTSTKRLGFAKPPMLVLISDGDEALMMLKIAEGLDAALRGLWRLAVDLPLRIFAAQRRLGNQPRLFLPIFAAVTLLFLAVGLRVDVTSPFGTGYWSPLIVLKFVGTALMGSVLLIGLCWAVLVFPGFIMVIVGYLWLGFVRWLAFGWAGDTGVDMTAETCPVGTAQITRLRMSKGARGLRHSYSHDDPRAPRYIARFIRATMGLQARKDVAAPFPKPGQLG